MMTFLKGGSKSKFSILFKFLVSPVPSPKMILHVPNVVTKSFVSWSNLHSLCHHPPANWKPCTEWWTSPYYLNIFKRSTPPKIHQLFATISTIFRTKNTPKSLRDWRPLSLPRPREVAEWPSPVVPRRCFVVLPPHRRQQRSNRSLRALRARRGTFPETARGGWNLHGFVAWVTWSSK